ncbi:hypothetical protein DFJ73DRAFT_786583 [Zopfochytrium polystomum]|nr:hypothetical protein DFJ73DRAFT_786583 [Zopfochytrium polystomum]
MANKIVLLIAAMLVAFTATAASTDALVTPVATYYSPWFLAPLKRSVHLPPPLVNRFFANDLTKIQPANVAASPSTIRASAVASRAPAATFGVDAIRGTIAQVVNAKKRNLLIRA